ncbi:hypothetical protein Efla_001855 [Eimeria flavescens]
MAYLAKTCTVQRLYALKAWPLARALATWEPRNLNYCEQTCLWLHGTHRREARCAFSTLTSQQKRILYRSKQRGWVELDLILSTFTESRIGTLSPEARKQREPLRSGSDSPVVACATIQSHLRWRSECMVLLLLPQELQELEKILEEENVVLYGCLVGNNGVYDEPPPNLRSSRLFQQLKDFVVNDYPSGAAPESNR